MGYIYAVMWMIIGIMIFIRARKLNKAFYLISFYFEFVGVWWLINEITNLHLFEGTYIWIFRIISAVMLIIVSVLYFKEKNKSK